jgi:hypothetical protein
LWWISTAFFERPLSRRERTTLLCSIWSIPTIWNTLICFTVFSTFSFRDLLFEFLSWTRKVRLFEWHLMLQSRKLANDSTVRCSWIHGTFDKIENSICNLRVYADEESGLSEDLDRLRSTCLPRGKSSVEKACHPGLQSRQIVTLHRQVQDPQGKPRNMLAEAS